MITTEDSLYNLRYRMGYSMAMQKVTQKEFFVRFLNHHDKRRGYPQGFIDGWNQALHDYCNTAKFLKELPTL